MHACSSQTALADLKYLQIHLKTDRMYQVDCKLKQLIDKRQKQVICERVSLESDKAKCQSILFFFFFLLM